MSTEVIPTTPPTKLSRGAWYLLEGICQNPAPFTTPALTVQAAKIWNKVHKANRAKTDEFNFEKRLLRAEGESDAAFAVKADTFTEAFEAWQASDLELVLTKRDRTALEKGIAWALKNRDKVWPQNNEHILAILTEFDIEGADDAEDAE